MHKFYETLLKNRTNIDELGIDFKLMNYNFKAKPILFAGKALQYYNIRASKNDIDLIICNEDYEALVNIHPDNIKRIDNDFAVYTGDFELWKSIHHLGYDFFIEDAIEEEDFYIVSFEKLTMLKVLCMQNEKNINDLKLIKEKISSLSKEI